jgi:hypothetical protein
LASESRETKIWIHGTIFTSEIEDKQIEETPNAYVVVYDLKIKQIVGIFELGNVILYLLCSKYLELSLVCR